MIEWRGRCLRAKEGVYMATAYIGTSGWSYRHWGDGEFYPERMRTHEQLAFYARHFRTVELNVTFYRFCRPSTYQKWVNDTPEGFVFAVKMHREVTHRRRLRDVAEPTGDVLQAAATLGSKLGPVLFQLPPSLRADGKLLASTLSQLPEGMRSAWEFRHQSWFHDATYELLEGHNAALCIADSSRYPLVEQVTADYVYVRLHGHEKMYTSSYSDEELAQWAGKIGRWIEEGRDVYLYFDNDVEGAAPHNALALMRFLPANR
jgi:uncharacterized protein YecE (DUF72 family)